MQRDVTGYTYMFLTFLRQITYQVKLLQVHYEVKCDLKIAVTLLCWAVEIFRSQLIAV